MADRDMGVSAHTPGPWVVEQIDYELYGLDRSFEVKAGRRVVVQTHMREIKSEDYLLGADEANCRLIAAAPDLLEAAVMALELIECIQDEEGYSPSLCVPANELRKAIVKARGGA